MGELKTLEAQVKVTVPYQDADPGGVAWHGNYFRYFDTARCALLDKIDYGYRSMEASGYVWPIVDTRVRFIQSVRFDDELIVEARLVESEYRMKIEHTVRDKAGKRVSKAHTVQVAVEIATEELCIGSPPALLERLARFGYTTADLLA